MARSLRIRNQNAPSTAPSSPEPETKRPRRAAQQKSYQEDEDDIELEEEESITVDQPRPTGGSIKLKLKMPPSRLRESTTASAATTRNSVETAEIVTGPRSNRTRRQVIIESDSEDDDDDEEGEEDEDEDEEDEEAEADEDDEDAEGESDVEMEDAPPPPPVIKKTGTPSKPTITITAVPKTNKVKSVEAKELSMATGEDYDDDDLSDLSDDDEDGEGDIVEEDAIEDGEDDDADGDSFDEEDLSRAGTPDLSKLTKRQRALVDDTADDHFMALNMGPQSRLALTDEQRNMRRVEMARRRKNLSEKRNEEEKQDTINRLLKKQAPKRRGKISAAEIAAGAETPDVQLGGVESEEIIRPNAVFSRWVSSADGIKVGVPVEWKGNAIGAAFGEKGWRAIEEVEL